MPVDNAVAAIVAALNATAMLDDAIVVVHSDLTATRAARRAAAPWGSSYPLRGRKKSYYEGGVRVPAFVYASSARWLPRRGAARCTRADAPRRPARGVRAARPARQRDRRRVVRAAALAALLGDEVASLDQWDAIAGRRGPTASR